MLFGCWPAVVPCRGAVIFRPRGRSTGVSNRPEWENFLPPPRDGPHRPNTSQTRRLGLYVFCVCFFRDSEDNSISQVSLTLYTTQRNTSKTEAQVHTKLRTRKEPVIGIQNIAHEQRPIDDGEITHASRQDAKVGRVVHFRNTRWRRIVFHGRSRPQPQ